MPRHTVAFAATAATALFLAAIAFFYWQNPRDTGRPAPGPSINAAGIERLLKSTLTDSQGKPTAIAAWQGKILVVNFWATWCPPCIREMPELSRTSVKYADKGVQFVGIGIDSPSAIKEYLFRHPVNYPILIGGSEGLETARALGNASAALPFTVILDASGRPLFSRLGAVDASQLDEILTPLISG